MNDLTIKTFDKAIKDIFASKPSKTEKPSMMLGIDCVKAMRNSQGDEWTYNFINSCTIRCGMDTYDYIIDFLKNLKRFSTAYQDHLYESQGDFCVVFSFERLYAACLSF